MGKTGKTTTVFVCRECGKESLRWLGYCPGCQQWNTYVETTKINTPGGRASSGVLSPPEELSQISPDRKERCVVPLAEFNRVLGGGVVAGSLVLIAGEPGIGKSTLLLRVADLVARQSGRVVYVSGEETARQIKLRAERLGVSGDGIFLIPETALDVIIGQLEELRPALAVIDSIQTVYQSELDTAPGSIAQVRECTVRLMRWAKQSGVQVIITGHVTKDGSIAGPRVLEHIVDAVLYLEGEPFSAYRLLRCNKNRFGSTNEVGIFEMKSAGLIEVADPSQVLLARREAAAVGSVVVPALEGSRTLLVEIQALTNPTSFGLPRRTANGVDFGRLLMITAVLSRRCGLKLGNQDIIVNVTGGLRIGEPAADLGIALAIASSYRDAEVIPGLVAVGEVGLSGELRAVSQLERRVGEAARLGFECCLVPEVGGTIKSRGIKLVTAASLKAAITQGLRRQRATAQEA